MTQHLQETNDAGWESHATLLPSDAPAKVLEAVDYVITELSNGTLRVASRESVGR